MDGDYLDRQKEAARKYAIASWDIAKAYRVITGKKIEVDPAEYTVPQPEVLVDAPNWKPVEEPVIKSVDDVGTGRTPFTQQQLLIGGGLLVGIVFLSLIISFLYAKASKRSSKNLF
jgi:hypothetical protein